MAKIKLMSSFSLIPEGRYVMQVTDAKYDETFGKIVVTLATEKGQTHNERFNIISKTGELNEKALSVFSSFANTILQDYSEKEIETDELIGKYILCVVEHEEYTNKDDDLRTKAKIVERYPANGFNDITPEKKEPEKHYNLDDVL